MKHTFRSVRKSKELLSSLQTSPQFFKFVDKSIPKIRDQFAFKALVRITTIIPLLISVGLFLSIVVAHQRESLKWGLLAAVFFIGSGIAWLSRYILEMLATSLELSQIELAQNEEQFRLLANSIPELVSVASGDGKPLWYNDAWYRYTGSSPQQQVGISWKHVHHPDYFPLVFNQWKTALETGNGFESHFPLKGKDGQYRRFHYQATPVRDQNKKIVLWFGTSKDVEAEMTQIEDQQFLKEATSSINRSLDFDTILSVCSQRLLPELIDFGVALFFDDNNPKQISSFYHFVESESLAVSKDELLRLVRHFNESLIIQGEVQVQDVKLSEERFVKENGFDSAALFPIVSQGKTRGALMIFAKAEKPLVGRRLNLVTEFSQLCVGAINNSILHEDLKEAVLVRDNFIAVASHELKTPLTALQLLIQLLERRILNVSDLKNTETETDEDKSLAQTVGFCREQVLRLTHLVNQLLDTTQVQTRKVRLDKVSCDLSLRVDEICRRFQSEAQAKGIELKWTKKESLTGVWDPLRIDQIISNLLSNAIKYGEGRPVSVTLDLVESGTCARVTVRDQGMGIPKAMHQRIFERFARGAEDGHAKGLGLGLFISRYLVNAHGGRIEIKSAPGEGSEFSVILPLRQAPSQ